MTFLTSGRFRKYRVRRRRNFTLVYYQDGLTGEIIAFRE